MTSEEAKKLLDQVREGYPARTHVIRLALRVTGDIGGDEAVGGQRVDQPTSHEDWRARVRQRAILVGKSRQ